MAKKLARIDFRTMETAADTAVWVMNSSSPKGIIHINVREANGSSNVVTIPVTWIPVDMTTQATKAALVASPDFRRLVSMNMLALIDPESAMEFMTDKEAQEEAEKVYNRQNSDVSNIETSKQASVVESTQLNSMSINVCEGDFEEDTALSMVRSNASDLNRIDFEYIAKNSQHARVKSFAATQLAEM